jgi:hypothetical protein
MAKAINVVVTGNAAPLRKALGQTQSHLSDFASKARSALLPAAAALGGLAFAANGAINAAADLSEVTSKAGVLFGEAQKDIVAFSKTTANSFGLSRKAALDATTTFATFGKAAGLSNKDLSNFSIDLTKLSADLASFNNTTPEEAIAAIGSALRGESEPLRKYGVLLDDASLRQKALELGIVATTKNALTPQQKVLAAQALIMEQTSTAQGDFARTSDGLANQQRILKANLENVTAELGEKLLPIAVEIVSFFNDRLIPAIQGVVEWFSEKGFSGTLKYITDEALPQLKEKLIEFGKAFVEWIPGATQELIANLPKIGATILEWALRDGIPKVVEIAGKIGLALAGFVAIMGVAVLKGLGEFIVNLVKELPRLFSAAIEGFAEIGLMIGDAIGAGIKKGLEAALDVVVSVARTLINGVIQIIEDGLNLFFDGINHIIWRAEWTNGTANYPRLPDVDIPQLANGGIVKARPGGTLALLGEGGRDEAVVPLGARNNIGNTYQITVNAGVGDPREIGRQVVEYIQKYERTAGQVFAPA